MQARLALGLRGPWRKDSDVVCFGCRGDQHHPDSADKGLAEIIVAKDRHGPTGKVKLAFLEHLTKFANLTVGQRPTP